MAGIDEAGRGCLAGPVVASAVILPEQYDLPGLTDSKKVSAPNRSILEKQIKNCALAWGLGVIWPNKIDRINILQASLEAMAIAVSRLRLAPQCLLIDGNQTIPVKILSQFWKLRHLIHLPLQRSIIKGDAFIPPISAASILAKTFRDKLMISLAKIWPDYGFEQHKGYGTKQHLYAIKRFGPCKIHRYSFRGVLQPDDNQLTLF